MLNKEYFKVAHTKTRKNMNYLNCLIIVEYKLKELFIRDKKRNYV